MLIGLTWISANLVGSGDSTLIGKPRLSNVMPSSFIFCGYFLGVGTEVLAVLLSLPYRAFFNVFPASFLFGSPFSTCS